MRLKPQNQCRPVLAILRWTAPIERVELRPPERTFSDCPPYRDVGAKRNPSLVDMLEAAAYRTRGGKFVTSLSKTRKPALASRLAVLTMSAEDDDARDVKSTYRKATLDETFEDAVAWFKPGRLTDEIRKQLGLDKPVRIE
jgi:hypothetical protein